MPSLPLSPQVHTLKAAVQAGITRTIRSLVFALLVIALANASAQAQPGGGRGGRGGMFGGGMFGGGFGGGGFGSSFSSLLRDPAIKLEIQLTPEQEAEIRKVTESGGGGREAMQAQFAAIQEAETEEEKDKIRKEMAADMEKRTKEQDAAIKKLLKPEQSTRLEQIQMQRNGLSGVTKNDTLAQSLKITDAQKKKFLDIQADYDKKVAEMRNVDFRNMSREEREKIGEDQLKARTDRDAQLEQILTAEQKAAWEAKQGAPAPKSDRFGPPGGGRGGSRDRTADAGGGTVPRVAAREEKVPDGAVAVADFAVPSEVPMGTPKVAEQGTDSTPEKSGASTEKLMSFTFRFAPWDLVLKKFADHAGLTLDLNVVPVGTFNYYDDGKYTVTEALDILNGYLLQKGYILVRRDKFLVVVTVDNIEPNLVPDVNYADLDKRGRNELVRVILPIEGMSTETAADEAQKLLGPQGELVPLSKSGRLVVTDLASNVRRIHDLLNGMNAIPTNGPTFQSFQLKHVSVMEAEKVVRDLFGLPQRGVISTPVASSSAPNSQPSSSRFGDFGRGDFGRGDFGRGDFGRGDFRRGDFGRGDFGGGGDSGRSQQPPQTQTSTSSSNVASNSKISVATDLRTNTLMVTAKPEDLKIVELAIKTLDIDEKTNNQSRNLTGRNSPQLEVYPITTADPRVMIQTINNLVPSAIVNEDAKAKRLHVFATADEQLQIKALIHQIDGGIEGGETALVVQLRRLDPMGAAGSLRNLFKGNRDDNIPMIEADPIGKRLMIRGTTAQMTEIRQLLKQMGEDPDGTGVPDPSLRGPIRTLSLGGRDPQEFAELIEKLWPGRDSNPIRIVVPSAGNQTLKSGSHHEPDAASSRNAPQSTKQKRSASVIKTKVTTPIKVNADVVPSALENEAGAILEGVGELLEGKTVDDELEEATADDAAVNDVKQTSPAAPTEIQPADEASSGKTVPMDTKTDSSKKVAPKPAAAAPAGTASKDSKETPATAEAAADEPAAAPATSAEPAAKSASQENVEPRPVPSRSGKSMPQAAGDAAGKPVTVFPSGSNLVISSEDLDALDRIQALVEALAQASPKRQTWTVFYLRTADATETATMLGHLFPSGSVSKTTDPNSQTMMGSLTGGISSMGSSLMDMTGLSSLGAASALRIVPEIRANALYVSGPADLVHQVEDVLKVLDASELPESLRDRVPRMIPVEHADVDEVAAIIESLYKDYMQAPAAMPGGGGGGGLNPLALLMAASGGGDKQKGRGIRLTIGVDARTSSVVVSADEALYRQIEALVQTLDQKALEANRTTRIIAVDATRALLVQQALGSLTGKVKVSSTRGGPVQAVTPDESPAAGAPTGGSGRTGRGPRSGDSGNAAEEELRRRFLQGAGILPGGDNNGGSNGGGRGGRGGFGGGRPRGQ